MHIILILGTSGKKDEKFLYNFKGTQGQYHNSTDYFLSLGKHYTILGTKEAFAHQIDLLHHHSQILKHFDNNANHLETSNPEILFDKILETLKTLKDSSILIDITHGFRDQPLLATLASLIAKVNFKSKIQLLYARETTPKESKQYHYETLDDYINIGLKSFLLTSFIQTLTIPKISIQDNLIRAL